MKPEKLNHSAALQEQAGYWVFKQHSPDWSPANERQLQAWLEQDASHRQEYARALKLWQGLDHFTTASFPARKTAQALRARHLQRRRRAQAARRAAATGIIALIAAIGINESLTTDSYRTKIGQRQIVTLVDGSEISLNTDTELQVKIAGRQRLVNLTHGEAFFTVTHDAESPFEVIATNARIRDIGTRFNVYAGADTAQVAVTEGEVEIIADPRLTQHRDLDHFISRVRSKLPFNSGGSQPGTRVPAGQQLSYNRLGEMGGLSEADTGKITAWREGRLAFEMEPLKEVVAQISRYHPVKIQLAEDKIRQLKVTANFDSADLTLILKTLQAAFPIKAERLDGSTIKIVSVER